MARKKNLSTFRVGGGVPSKERYAMVAMTEGNRWLIRFADGNIRMYEIQSLRTESGPIKVYDAVNVDTKEPVSITMRGTEVEAVLMELEPIKPPRNVQILSKAPKHTREAEADLRAELEGRL